MFEHNHVPEIVQEILPREAWHVLRVGAVTDASGNVVELANLRPDGTIGEPEAEVDSTDDPDHTGGEEGVDAWPSTRARPAATSRRRPRAPRTVAGPMLPAMTEAYGSSLHIGFD